MGRMERSTWDVGRGSQSGVAAPSTSTASGSSDRPSTTRRMRRYKPQAAGHASLPRLASLMLGSIAVLLLSTAAIIALSRWITNACRPLSSSVCHVWLSSHSVRVAMGWVSIGIAFGTLLQTNLLRSNILSVLYYVNLPISSSSSSSQHPPPSPELDLLASLGLVLGRVGTATADHPVMVFKPHQGSVVLGSARAIMEHPIEITADMHFRRFREPFPDPAQPGLMGIELVEEVPLPQWQCVYRKRKLQLKNNTPGFIRRFANAEYFDVIEESLWDKANQVLYVVGRNQSFAHLVLIEDFLLFRRHDDHDHWSQVTQTGACTVGGSFGFLRGTVEGFVRESYGKSVKKAQEHLVDRLDEECGARTSSMSTT
ncbi:hypothetical protein, variant [Aphanomyces astaci]|uniref:PRELI/MSF1 domain-containing protein n=1 Tax=Aphanomyces astaci TaxID=112090 RepID=W4GFA1_APHAT|nr:hypothetical protein, variant [Aphanomyces astaci]ETV77946.1 hypothetical protein, variant [Aphanomyces astaci]|eukprot:XP_009832283.1 hypothetical protein, variant [Aphanomyces astaci]